MSEKILVIDDENYVNRLLHFNLTEDGYEVISASGGQEGLDFAEQELPDLVILDIAMPETDGFEVLRGLKSNPRTIGLPVLVLTAKVMDEVKRKSMEMGAEDFMTKPFSPSDLSQRVKKILGK